uniref:Uncharacterized protein n=1 Tax=Arundo donax TaxID=35708 RepID=A0A0A8ZH81_ARUDO
MFTYVLKDLKTIASLPFIFLGNCYPSLYLSHF